tara:strand:- start:3890 stop:4318 length:429 start_codon:yes stop_codon:yes gene_type:complete
MLRSITISFVLFIGLFAINKVINYNSADNVLKKESIKIIDEIYSIKLASIIHEVETMKTPDNAQQLIDSGYLKSTIKNNISNKSKEISIKKIKERKEYIVTYEKPNQITEEFCETIRESLSVEKNIELKNCDKEVTQFIIKT